MDYFAAFDISVSGLEVQKTRLDVVASNLANANTTRGANGGAYQPLRVVVGERVSANFDGMLTGLRNQLGGATVVDIQQAADEPRLVHDPRHPDADDKGFVAYPNINPVSEMVDLMEATRSYEANVRAINVAKTMALRALEIGER